MGSGPQGPSTVSQATSSPIRSNRARHADTSDFGVRARPDPVGASRRRHRSYSKGGSGSAPVTNQQPAPSLPTPRQGTHPAECRGRVGQPPPSRERTVLGQGPKLRPQGSSESPHTRRRDPCRVLLAAGCQARTAVRRTGPHPEPDRAVPPPGGRRSSFRRWCRLREDSLLGSALLLAPPSWRAPAAVRPRPQSVACSSVDPIVYVPCRPCDGATQDQGRLRMISPQTLRMETLPGLAYLRLCHIAASLGRHAPLGHGA
jgi:hypothetical protein